VLAERWGIVRWVGDTCRVAAHGICTTHLAYSLFRTFNMLFLCYHCENNLFMEQKNVDYPFRFDLCTCCNTAVALPSKEWLKFIVAVSIEHAKFSEGTSNINLWFRAESMSIPDLCRLKIKHFSCSNLIPVALISPSTKLVLGQIYSGPPPSPCAIQTSCRVGATYTLP